ncbi:hypothetical protein Tco_0487491 [Tanacetum coccineum]
MADFMPSLAVIDAAQRKRVNYEAKCADTGLRFGSTLALQVSHFSLAFGLDYGWWFGRIYVLVIMAVMRFHYPFVGLSCFHDGGGNGLTKTSLITHLRERHFNEDAQAIKKYSLASNFAVFEVADVMFKHEHDGFTLPLFDNLISKGLRTISFIHPKCSLGFFRVLKGALDKDMPGGSLQLVREALAEPSPSWSIIYEVNLDLALSSSGVDPYKDATLEDLKVKHPFKPTPSLPHIYIDHHQLGASPAVVLDMVKSFPLVVNIFHDGKCPKVFCEYIASAPLTSLVKSGVGIHPRVLGTVWRRLVSKVSAAMIGNSLDGYLNYLQFSVGVSRGGDAILHVMNRLIKDRRDDVDISMLLVALKNAFNLVDREVMLQYLDDDTIIRDTLVMGKVLELIMDDGPRCGLHLNVDKTEPLHGVIILGRSANVDFNYSSELAVKRAAKTIELIDAIAKIDDPHCELLLLRACAGISKLYFTMRTCSPWVFERVQHSFDAALHSALDRIVIARCVKIKL